VARCASSALSPLPSTEPALLDNLASKAAACFARASSSIFDAAFSKAERSDGSFFAIVGSINTKDSSIPNFLAMPCKDTMCFSNSCELPLGLSPRSSWAQPASQTSRSNAATSKSASSPLRAASAAAASAAALEASACAASCTDRIATAPCSAWTNVDLAFLALPPASSMADKALASTPASSARSVASFSAKVRSRWTRTRPMKAATTTWFASRCCRGTPRLMSMPEASMPRHAAGRSESGTSTKACPMASHRPFTTGSLMRGL